MQFAEFSFFVQTFNLSTQYFFCYKSFKPPAVANPRKPKESCQTLPVTQNTAWQSIGCHALLCNSQARPKDKRISPHEIPHNSE